MLLLRHRAGRARTDRWGISRRALEDGDRVSVWTTLGISVSITGLESRRLSVVSALLMRILDRLRR